MRLRSVARFAALCSIAALLFGPLRASAAPSALDPADFDRSVAPSADLFRFANGGWLRRNPIPADRAEWGIDVALTQVNEERMRAMLTAPEQTGAPGGTERRKLADFYAACMDEDAAESNALAALRPAFEQIAAMSNARDVARASAAIARLHAPDDGIAPLFSIYSEQDPNDARRVIGTLQQGGLVLPSRDYYLGRDAASRSMMATYRATLNRTFEYFGEDPAAAARDAAAVVRIETRIARISLTADALRDPVANTHPMPLSKLAALAPHFDWRAYVAAAGFPARATGRIDVGQPRFVRGLDAILASEPYSAWKSYLRWHAVVGRTYAVPQRLERILFALSRALNGTAKEPPRWRRCTDGADRVMGYALGRIYVARYFPPAARERARYEVAAIVDALRADLGEVPWMGPVSRAAALAKLAKLNTSKIGYPDVWRSYAALRVTPNDYLADVLAGARYEFDRELAKIGKPVDRTEWGIPPQTVDAYYDPSMNEIVIPAGILQPPFFDPSADDAVNFGGIGAAIGHELTHGYDDEGTQYDGDGNLRAWMTPADTRAFHTRIDCIVKQADAYAVLPGLHLNGKLVAGEATADLGGLVLALRALRTAQAGQSPPPPLDGYDALQRFFLGYAASWRSVTRPALERQKVLSDPHPPAVYRTNATVSDMDDFDAAFGVAPGAAMYRSPAERCKIW